LEWDSPPGAGIRDGIVGGDKVRLQSLLPELMKFRVIHLLLVISVISLHAGTRVEGATREGVAFPDIHEVGGTVLRVRGVGLLRYMAFIKVYVAAFYLEDDIPSEKALSDVPKRLEISYFHGITAEDFARSTDAFIEKNVEPELLPHLRSRIHRLNAWYEDVKPNDRYALTYIPGQGTELALNGEVKGVIQGSDFAAAVFSMWLGREPVNESLKRGLLGGQ